ncbi:MAG: YihY/virulence factor BrkB family protein [Porphyromonas sp.]|nr:YihY/virulence factor BrkB family protein [Porphyromonas sp.]
MRTTGNSQDRAEVKEQLERLQEKRKQGQSSFFRRAKYHGIMAYRFVTNDIWRLHDNEVTGMRGFFVKTLRVIYISVKEFVQQVVPQKASSLTYTTLLSIVPVLVILLSVATGFGMSESVQRALYEYFPAHQEELTAAFVFVERYVDTIQGGLLIGVGIAILLYSVMAMFIAVENTVNYIWQIKKGRPFRRRVFGYLAWFFLLPLSIIFASLANIFISSLSSITLLGNISLTPLASVLLKVLPYVILVIIFTSFYLLVPNTKVRFVPAFISGVLVGVAFQIFQMFYISGQLWVSRYNAIYGSFAALPLLMLYIHLTWVIVLFGAQLSYAIQNADRYAFKSESDSVSRRFRDFVALLIMKKVELNFRHEGKAYTAEELAQQCNLPISVVSDTIEKLVACKLLVEIPSRKNKWSPTYMPGVEVSTITVGRVLTALDRLGSESFRVDLYDEYAVEWDIVRRSRITRETELDMLVIDL